MHLLSGWFVVVIISLVSLLSSVSASAIFAQDVPVYPGIHWETKRPDEVGLNAELLDQFAVRVGGDGCVIRNGYLVKSWGEVTRHKDWASAAKPVLGTLLLLAVEEGKLASVDARLVELGWELSSKDSNMTFRHLANMVSGYGLGEPPGAAWGYNDFAIQLYAKSLAKVFGESLDLALHRRLAALQFEDGEFFGSRKGAGVSASSRDFARLGWLWLQRGRWKDEQLNRSIAAKPLTILSIRFAGILELSEHVDEQTWVAHCSLDDRNPWGD